MKTGSKVVCVDDSVQPWDGDFFSPNGDPIKGEVYCVGEYVVEGSFFNGFLMRGEGDGVTIVGKPTYHIATGVEWTHMAKCFRLVSEVGHPPVQQVIPQPEPDEIPV